MIRIALILPSLRQTGPIILANNLVKELSSSDVRFVVFYFDEFIEMSFPCETKRIKFGEVPDFSEFDVLHTHGLRPDFYYWWHRKKINKPSIATVHQYIYDNLAHDYSRLTAFLVTPLWELALVAHKAIVCINMDMQSRYQKRRRFKKVKCIYNGVNELVDRSVSELDVETINQIKRLKEQGKTIVLTIAGLNKVKGLNQMLEVVSEDSNLVYVIIGEGPERVYFQSQIELLGIQERFLLLGFKKNARAFIQFADVYLMPSRSEAFGLSLIEAATERMPIICSDIITFRELFTEQEVIFFKLDDKESLLSAIKQVARNSKDLGENAYSKYTKFYTSRIMAKNYLSLYKELLSV